MSRVMADLCRLLQVQQLRTSVYHPQTDGLVERFNQMLKQMLRRVVAEDGRDWDLMILYVLFGIREVPQASTEFTPFELLFGRQPRGLLDVVREAWENQPAPHHSLIEHVRGMRERIDRVMPLVREHLVTAQRTQQHLYDNKTQVQAFLGLTGYYRCFIPNFSSIAYTLSDLIRKGQPEKIVWTPEAEASFQALNSSRSCMHQTSAAPSRCIPTPPAPA